MKKGVFNLSLMCQLIVMALIVLQLGIYNWRSRIKSEDYWLTSDVIITNGWDWKINEGKAAGIAGVAVTGMDILRESIVVLQKQGIAHRRNPLSKCIIRDFIPVSFWESWMTSWHGSQQEQPAWRVSWPALFRDDGRLSKPPAQRCRW